MKYHTSSLGSNNLLSADTKTSGFTAYADIGLSENNKMCYTERDFKKIRKELENVQHDLKLQTKRCRHLVDEFTRKLQEKEQLFQNEKFLRDTQLAKVLKALLIFEARLRQEQKLISHQLNEKDYIIKTQNNDIKKILSNSYCKNCNQYFARNLESLDSGSEYAGIENGYQSSNLESLDSSSETYGAVSSKSGSELYEKIDNGTDVDTNKNNNKPYFQVLKLRNESPMSNDDNTSADYDNLDSLPPESVSDKISLVSSNIEDMLTKSRSLSTPNSDSSLNISSSDCNKTVITAIQKIRFEKDAPTEESSSSANPDGENKLLTDRIIPVFECTDDGNDKWYASASDQEDEDHSNVYRNNPVLECMNQILLQNIDDLNSPPKTPNIERKTNKNNKRVKFSDEECTSTTTSLQDGNLSSSAKTGYYEIPIQATPNYYETPQSIYSNDYEQILSKSSECGDYHHQKSILITNKNDINHHHYIEMEKEPIEKCTISSIALTKKNKILRVPPALPPKPPNLVAKCKITPIPKRPASNVSSNCDLEPDYCSISELNLPPNKTSILNNKISVVAEVHISPTSSQEIKNRLSVPSVEKTHKKTTNNEKDEMPSLVVKKCVEKFNIIDLAKQTPIKLESSSVHNNNNNKVSPKKKNGVQIPKLPQVSEIIIPDDPEDVDDRISQDNYIKNSTQILNDTNNKSTNRDGRKPVVMGSSVSSIINGFNNNNQFIDELKRKHERIKVEVPKNKGFSGFENVQNLDKSFTKTSEPNDTSHRMDSFDLSQNFEEFKLDDCEIEEYDVEEELEREEKSLKEADKNIIEYHLKTVSSANNNNINKLLENNKADLNLSKKSIEQFKRQLQIRQQIQHNEALNNMSVFHNKNNNSNNNNNKKSVKPPTYDHFLECTGLSTKSILSSSNNNNNNNVVQSHKNMLKFNKDIKVRSKVKANANIFEKLGQSRGNYWSEPFV